MSSLFVSNPSGYLGKAILHKLTEVDKFVQHKTPEEEDDDTELLKHPALAADAIVINTLDGLEEAVEIVKALEQQEFEGNKVLILVTCLHTWSATTSQDLVDALDEDQDELNEVEEGRLSADRYTRRKPGPAHVLYHQLEEQVINMAHDNLATCVVSAGIPYGRGEVLFESIFSTAWLGEVCQVPAMVHRNSNSPVPTIHVLDLASTILAAAADPPTNQPYVVAIDHSNESLLSIIHAIQSAIRPGEDTAETMKLLDDVESAQLLVNDESWLPLCQLQLSFTDDSRRSIDSLVGVDSSDWHSYSGLPSNMALVAKEFTHARELAPVRLVVLGAPGAGSEQMVQELAKKYYLPVVSDPKVLVQELYTELQQRAQKEQEGKDEVNEQEDEQEVDLAALSAPEKLRYYEDKLLEDLNSITQGGKKLELITGAALSRGVRVLLSRPKFLNPGFILADWPQTITEAEALFVEELNDEAEEAGEENSNDDGTDNEAANEQDMEATQKPKLVKVNWFENVKPTSVIVLDGENEVLKEKAVQEQNENDKEFDKLLKKHRELKDSFTTGSWFKDKDIMSQDIVCTPQLVAPADIPEVSIPALDAEGNPVDPEAAVVTQEDVDRLVTDHRMLLAEFRASVHRHVERNGAAFNYHPTPKEAELLRIEAENEKLCEEFEEAKSVAAHEAQEEKQRMSEETAVQRSLEDEAEQDNIQLEERSKPLREYLMKHVMPVLSKGLLECCKDQPDDPIDFLAEFLFKNKLETSRTDEEAES